MNRILDKTFTLSVRQVWRWTRRLLYVVLLVYPVMIFLNAWNVRVGGTALHRSPFQDRIPPQCKERVAFRGSHFHLPNSQSRITDVLLLSDRVKESPVEELITGIDKSVECFGGILITGMHSEPAGVANVIRRWIDTEGRPVISVHVQYHQSLKDIGFTSKRVTDQ
jgi:hypothetical protein